MSAEDANVDTACTCIERMDAPLGTPNLPCPEHGYAGPPGSWNSDANVEALNQLGPRGIGSTEREIAALRDRLAQAMRERDEALLTEAKKARAYWVGSRDRWRDRAQAAEAQVRALERQLQTEAGWTANDLTRERELKTRVRELEREQGSAESG